MGCTHGSGPITVVELSVFVGRANKRRLCLRLGTFKCGVTSDCVGTPYKHRHHLP